MSGVQKNHSASFKAKVALEAIKQDKTIAQLPSKYGVHIKKYNIDLKTEIKNHI